MDEETRIVFFMKLGGGKGVWMVNLTGHWERRRPFMEVIGKGMMKGQIVFLSFFVRKEKF